MEDVATESDLGLSIIFLDHIDMMSYSFSFCVFFVDIYSINVGNILLQDWKNSFWSLIGVKHNYVAQCKLNIRLQKFQVFSLQMLLFSLYINSVKKITTHIFNFLFFLIFFYFLLSIGFHMNNMCIFCIAYTVQ